MAPKSNIKGETIGSAHLIVDVLAQVLRNAENPEKAGHEITEELRDLTGARTVLLMRYVHESSGNRSSVIALSPDRRRALADSMDVRKLAHLAYGLLKPTLWTADDDRGEVQRVISRMGVGNSIATPLTTGSMKVGCLILLGVPSDPHGMPLVLQTLEVLSTALALVFRIAEHTSELTSSNTALQKSEEHYSLAQHAGNIGSWEWDLATGDLEWSEQTERMFGFSKGDFTGTYEQFLECVHPDDRQHVVDSANTCIASDGEYGVQHRIVWPDGTLRWVSENGNTYRGGDGKASRMLGVVQDITERKRAEEEREQLITTLEAQNAELERFAYTVSHDLKTPLITMRNYLGVLQEDVAAGDSDAVDDDIARMVRATGTMAGLLNDLLRISRAGRVLQPEEDVALEELVGEVAELMADRLERIGARVEVLPGLPTVFGDRTWLFEVVQNLIDNAVKYAGEQPQPHITIGTRIENGETVCFVRDNGIGIDPKYHERVFDLFEQLDRESEGSGAGLAIVKRVVEMHGGRIWVESQGRGHGSTFCFTLPAQPCHAK